MTATPPPPPAAPVGRASGPPLRFVLGQLAEYRATLAAAIVWSILFVLVPMQVPLLTGALVSGVSGQGATFLGVLYVAAPGDVLTLAAVGLGLTALAYGATAYLSTASVSEMSRRFVAGLRKRLVLKLDTASVDVHERFGSGELLNRVLVDTQSTREFVETVFFDTLQNVLRVAYPVAILFLLSPTIAVVAAAFLPVQYFLTRQLQGRLREATRRARTTQGRLTSSVKENLDGIETIQTSHAETVAVRRLWAQSDQLATDQISAKVYAGLITGSTWAVTSLGLAITWWIGGLAVLSGGMSLGTLVAITGFVVLLYAPMQRFTTVANVYQKGLVAFERIQEVLTAPSRIVDDPRAPALRVTEGRVTLDHVAFRYDGREVLRDVSLELGPRGLTILLGRNGSGKSTLLKLLTRLYDPAAGSVRIDGQDLRSVRLASLREQVAVVPQRATVFSGTLADNLRLGRPEATEPEVLAAARQAGLDELLARLPRGLATIVGPGGTGLSGGEAQRVAIARALLRRPRLLLLDEPNSALDVESEARLVATLETLKQEMTIVIIAHHADAMLHGIDRVVVLDDGQAREGAAEPPRAGSRKPVGGVRRPARWAVALDP